MALQSQESETRNDEEKVLSIMKPGNLVPVLVFVVSTAAFAWMHGLFRPGASPEPSVLAAVEQAGIVDRLPQSNKEQFSDTNHSDATAGNQSHAQGSRIQANAAPDTLTDANAMRTAQKQEQWVQNELLLVAQQRQDLDAREADLVSLKQEISNLLSKVQEHKSERITMMARVYNNMDPRAAAKQLSTMDDHTVLLLLPQMNTRTAAKVMAAIEPGRAAQLTSKVLALDP
jgi:flagellar motility protein MotE (MotC chaperone)